LKVESKDTIAKLQEKNSQSATSRTILSKEEASSPTALEVLSKISKDGEKVSSNEASDQSEVLVKDAEVRIKDAEVRIKDAEVQTKDAEVQTKDAIAVNSKNSKVALKSVDSAAAVNNEEPIIETSGHKKDSNTLDISKPAKEGKPVEKDDKELKAAKKSEGMATPTSDQVPEPASQSSSEREESNDELEELNKFDFSDHSLSGKSISFKKRSFYSFKFVEDIDQA
jgi:hypothetical protein